MSWVDVTTAIGTASAAAVALGLGLRGIYLDRHRKRDDELRQARLVMISEPLPLLTTSERNGGIAIKVYNYSNEPIHDVSVELEIWEGGRANGPPDETEAVQWDFPAPREECEIVFDISQDGQFVTGRPELTFLDSSGRRFRRRATQTEPERILHEPQLVVQIVDG